MDRKKNPVSLHLKAEDFELASSDEKESLIIMRESVNFWKDGMRRLKKNKIASPLGYKERSGFCQYELYAFHHHA